MYKQHMKSYHSAGVASSSLTSTSFLSLSHALQSTVHIFPHERVNAGIFMNTVR